MPDTRTTVADKLEPIRVSGKFRALLAFLLNERGWTDPEIRALTITSDGILLDSSSGFANDILGDVGDLERNIRGVAEVADMTSEETRWLLDQIATQSSDFRRTQ